MIHVLCFLLYIVSEEYVDQVRECWIYLLLFIYLFIYLFI
jgi:hypothetical protein